MQDQFAICAIKEIKVLFNRKGKIKVQIEKGSKSPNRKGK